MFNYDLHPVLVHFPIALLTIYCMMEFVSWGRLRTARPWVFAKGLLATIGGLSLLLARQFGDQAKHLLADRSKFALVSRHEQFANYSIFIFGIIGVGYLLALTRLYTETHPNSVLKIFSPLYSLQRLITETPLAQVLALGGILLLTITGALGGSIVYGANVDPFTSFVIKYFYH